jgi:hypothetical protein
LTNYVYSFTALVWLGHGIHGMLRKLVFFYVPCCLVWIFIPGFYIKISLRRVYGQYYFIVISCVVISMLLIFSSWSCGWCGVRRSYFFVTDSSQSFRKFNPKGPHTFCCCSQSVHLAQVVIPVVCLCNSLLFLFSCWLFKCILLLRFVCKFWPKDIS